MQYKHFTPQIPTGTDRGIQGVSKGTDVDWCGKVRGWGIPLQHRMSSQRWADEISMPNTVLTFKHPVGVVWLISGFLDILINNVFFQSENFEKSHDLRDTVLHTKLNTEFSSNEGSFYRTQNRLLILGESQAM